jgi:hypothetical protein
MHAPTMKHLIGSFLPELKDATVDGTSETSLEGYYAVAATDAIDTSLPHPILHGF